MRLAQISSDVWEVSAVNLWADMLSARWNIQVEPQSQGPPRGLERHSMNVLKLSIGGAQTDHLSFFPEKQRIIRNIELIAVNSFNSPTVKLMEIETFEGGRGHSRPQ